jgi:Raf kinase inhibitor-like YbhB/YbcL family protein
MRTGVVVGLALAFLMLVACRGSATLGEDKPKLELTSASFAAGQIPAKFTCDGSDTSPKLGWGAPPATTQSFALIVFDPDAPSGEFVHWVAYNLPAEKRELAEGLPKQEQLPDGTRQGMNDFDKTGYGGPCPPGKLPHRYVFVLYALDTKLSLPRGATREQVEKALKGHILARGELIGRYQR